MTNSPSQLVDIALPKLGESIVGATVVQWLKKVGDSITLDEPLLEVSTDKVNSEIPSPVAGILIEILVKEEEEIEIGALLARIDTGQEASSFSVVEPTFVPQMPCSRSKTHAEVFSPAVQRLAQIEGLGMETLKKIDGTGEEGRITKKDVERFLQERTPCPLQEVAQENEERIRLTGVRKAIAQNMVRSFYEAPHASLVIEADVTEISQLITREKERFKETHGAKLTITGFLIQGLTKAIQEFPLLNASLEGETIVMKRYVNVGLAVHIDGGLLVPVIKNCHERNLASIAKAAADMAGRARSGKLAPDEVTGGTVTLTNFGMTGALIGVPIIRYPEVAIIGAGAIQKRVVVQENDSLAIRQMVYLTLTFDHRVIDGVYGCEFLSAFKHHLESVSTH